MTCAKGITSGYLPLGAVIVSPWSGNRSGVRVRGVFRHGYTYSGHAAASAAALANLDIIEGEALLERVAELEPVLEATLRPLESHPLVAEVRAGLGLLGAVSSRRLEARSGRGRGAGTRRAARGPPGRRAADLTAVRRDRG